MRPRTTGISETARSQQQPSQALTFKPKSEWKHENEVSVLFLYLPGFTMEQLTITPDYSKRTINVEGKRRLPNNRLLPVNETFGVPEDCKFLKLDKQFGKGILMLKFPNKSPRHTKVTKNDQERTRINDIEASIDENSVMGAAKTDEEKFVEKEDPIGDGEKFVEKEDPIGDGEKFVEKEDPIGDGEKFVDGNGKEADESDVKNLKEVESQEQSKESSSTTLYKTPNDSTNTKRGDESGDAKASTKKDMTKEVMNGDLKSITSMFAAVLAMMGLGVSLYYAILHKLIS